MTRRLIAAFAVVFLTSFSVAEAQFLTPPNPWVPPTGIPAPPFGISQQPPARPSAWPSSAANGFYYVDRTHSAATDSSNPNGYPNRPRVSIPTTLPAGSYVEVRGSGYSVSGTVRFTLNGTAGSPVWIVGVDQPTFTGQQSYFNFDGSYYVVQGLRLVDTKVSLGGTHATLRQTEVMGSTADSGSMLSVAGGSSYIVYYNNLIHDNGPLDSGVEADLHGLKVSTDALVHHVWYLDNHSYRNSGDSVQLGSATASSSNWSHTLFIGRNVMHEDRENACDIKAVRDVIISDNTMYNYTDSSSASGEACAAHNGSERLWIVNNKVYNSERGITSTGATGFYVIGNLIYNINQPGYSSTSLSQGHAVMTRATSNIVIAGNTIHNVNHGIGIDGTGTADIINNIISDVSSVGHHLGWASSTGFNGSVIKHNLLEGAVRVTVGSTVYSSVAAFQNSSNKSGSINGSPEFLAVPSDFRLSPSSPAVNAGYATTGGGPHPVYALFESTYPTFGTIRMDFTGLQRPLPAVEWDLGAFEGTGKLTTPPPAAPAGLRIIR